MSDLLDQTYSLPYALFGVKFLNMGFRKKDRDINRRLKIYKNWGKKIVSDRR